MLTAQLHVSSCCHQQHRMSCCVGVGDADTLSLQRRILYSSFFLSSFLLISVSRRILRFSSLEISVIGLRL